MVGLPGLRAPGDAAADRAAYVGRAVVTAGRPGAPALVLLHGTRRTRAMWRRQLVALGDAFHVIAVDLPGHGSLAGVPFGLARASDFVADVVDEVAGGRAVVVGQSLGGYVAMDLAARRPAAVAGLVLVSATTEPRAVARRAPRTVGSYVVAALRERLRDAPRGGAGAAGARREAGISAPAVRVLDTPGAMASPEPDPPATDGWLFRGGGRAIVSALRQSFLPRLAAYPGATLIVNGEEDALFRSGERAFLAAAVNGRLVVVPRAGHLVGEEQPAAFEAAVRRFAAEVGGGASSLPPLGSRGQA
jgi:pimeloyl-ACP methyl ester carboxylesterase